MFCCWIRSRQFTALPSTAGLTRSGTPLCLRSTTHFEQESWHQVCHKAERYMCDLSAFLLQTIPSVSSPPSSPQQQAKRKQSLIRLKKLKQGYKERGNFNSINNIGNLKKNAIHLMPKDSNCFTLFCRIMLSQREVRGIGNSQRTAEPLGVIISGVPQGSTHFYKA